MVATIVEIARLKFKNVHFYTILVRGKPVSEFEDFVNRMSKKCPTKLGELLHFIDEIGQKYKVEEKYFRHERNSHALPPNYIHLTDDDSEENSEFGLRLYCCRFTPEIVVLYNGDLKTKHYPDECPNVSKHFKLALEATKRIDQARQDEYLAFDGVEILVDEDFMLEI